MSRGVEESGHVRDEANSDEEIASDSEDDTRENSHSESEEQNTSVAVKERLQRKRKHPGWVSFHSSQKSNPSDRLALAGNVVRKKRLRKLHCQDPRGLPVISQRHH